MTSAAAPLPAVDLVPDAVIEYMAGILDAAQWNRPPCMQALMNRCLLARDAWAFGETDDCVYADIHGHASVACFSLHAWSSGHRFFREEKDSIARRFRLTSEGCVEFRRLAVNLQEPQRRRVEIRAMERLARRMTEQFESAVVASNLSTREMVVLLPPPGTEDRKLLVYLKVGQTVDGNDVSTFLHAERVECSELGSQYLAQALLGTSSVWDVAPLDEAKAIVLRENMLAFLMCMHTRLGEHCCSWLRAIDASMFEEPFREHLLRRESVGFGEVVARVAAHCSE